MSKINFYHNKKVLVTGGAGFIGSYLVKKLVQIGAQVTVFDNLFTGNLQNLKDVKSNIRFINGSITDLDLCIKATTGQEIVFHLAAFISVPESMSNPVLCNNINIQGTYNLLQAAISRHPGIRFIFSSSSAVYGQSESVCNENLECKPNSIYGFSKLIGENLCKMYSEIFGLPTICLRYFNVYGEGQNKEGAYAAVVAKFSDLMKNNQPITIFGDGKQRRDFIHVEKVIEANLNLGMLDIAFLNGQSVNIATGKSITLLELIENLKKELPNYNQEILFEPARAGDILSSQADCSKYLKLIESMVK